MSRTEEFEATRPNGEVLLIERDIDTGEQTATVLREAPEPAVESDEPKGNASREAWAAWADHLEVTYPEDAKRDDIKALVVAAQTD